MYYYNFRLYGTRPNGIASNWDTSNWTRLTGTRLTGKRLSGMIPNESQREIDVPLSRGSNQPERICIHVLRYDHKLTELTRSRCREGEGVGREVRRAGLRVQEGRVTSLIVSSWSTAPSSATPEVSFAPRPYPAPPPLCPAETWRLCNVAST